MMGNQLNELMGLASVATTNSDARRWLETAVKATTPVLGVVQAPKPSQWNAPLNELEKRAKALLKQLGIMQRDHPHANYALWHASLLLKPKGAADDDAPGVYRVPLFAPGGAEDDDEPEEIFAIRAVEKIAIAAAQARVKRNGRPPKTRKQQAVNLAAAFFERYSPEKITSHRPANSVSSPGHSTLRPTARVTT